MTRYPTLFLVHGSKLRRRLVVCVLMFHENGLLGALTASELSDGTLRYLLLCTALLTPRPPELMVLNEPEASLHPDLIPALGRLIRRAAQTSQIWVISHSTRLSAALDESAECNTLVLDKVLSETTIQGSICLTGRHGIGRTGVSNLAIRINVWNAVRKFRKGAGMLQGLGYTCHAHETSQATVVMCCPRQ